MSANAYVAYLKGSMDNWAEAHQFTNINDNELYIKLSGDYIHEGAIEIKPYVIIDNNQKWHGPNELTELSVDGSNLKWTDDGGGSANWKIAQNENAKDIYVYIKTNDNNQWWGITALVVEEYLSIPVTFNNSADWSKVCLYTYVNEIPFLTGWPGTEMSGSSGNFTSTLSVPEGTKIIFNSGSNANQTGNLDLVYNGFYNANGLAGVSASISSVGYATFSSTKAVDFSSETTIEACKASVSAGKITYTPVTTVAAGEGVLLRRADATLAAASAIIPINADQDITPAADNAFKGITTKQKLAQIADGNTNYILTIVDETLGFYKVNANGSWCAAGTAYLAVPTQQAPDFIALDGETTGIANVSCETISNNQYYTLDGRYIAQPTKGLYIVNGKKVIIK